MNVWPLHLAPPGSVYSSLVQCIRCGETLYDPSRRDKEWVHKFTRDPELWQKHNWKCKDFNHDEPIL